MALPTIDVVVGGSYVRALVDTGCSQTIVARRFVQEFINCNRSVMAVDGGEVAVDGEGWLKMSVNGKDIQIKCLVLSRLLPAFEIILGMDVVKKLDGVRIDPNARQVMFGLVNAAVILEPNESDVSAGKVIMKDMVMTDTVSVATEQLIIDDVDFSAVFDGSRWVVKWKWLEEEPLLNNKVGSYKMDFTIKEKFDEELASWINEGILIEVGSEEMVRSLVPLMAVEQINKDKVRPVLDFRELNQFVSCHSGDSAVCDETLRTWRQFGTNIQLLDLKKAYLQLHIDPAFWKHQVVRHNGKLYYLTRLGFGLSSAPRIMSKILKKVLSLDEDIKNSTDSYIDDIIVNTAKIDIDLVIRHLARYGLQTKTPAKFESVKVLGLQINRKNGRFCWSRGNNLVDLPSTITRRELFSICGQLVGHYPMAGWLRVSCGFIKRKSEGSHWDDDIGVQAYKMLHEMVEKVKQNDPVGGVWNVGEGHDVCENRVWCDASSLAVGCVLEINGDLIEDAAWLRPKEDGSHINLAELDAVVRGVNLAIKWHLTDVVVMTDSATVHSWLLSVLTDSHRVKTHGMAEMLVRRRLSVVKMLTIEYGLNLRVEWVPSSSNKADSLTRVQQNWLTSDQSNVCVVGVCLESLRESHNQHHFGVDRTWYLAKQKMPGVKRADVVKVVDSCQQCRSIDPAPVRWDHGTLEVAGDWQRLACDVTHYKSRCYLTLVDCGPSRFSIWRFVQNEGAESIIRELLQVFRERGPPAELLCDNGVFRSKKIFELCEKWSVKLIFRCAYKPSGNGIVERNHRTIKRMAARTNGDPLDMVFWLNTSPKDKTRSETVPALQLHSYRWRYPFDEVVLDSTTESLNGPMMVGEEVFVKPPATRCTTIWPTGKVSRINSSSNIEVDGIPRHVADIRPMVGNWIDVGMDEPGEVVQEELPLALRRPARTIKPPDYLMHSSV